MVLTPFQNACWSPLQQVTVFCPVPGGSHCLPAGNGSPIPQLSGLSVLLTWCIDPLRLPSQNTIDWEAETTEMYFLTVAEPRRSRSRGQQVWFLVRLLLLAWDLSLSSSSLSSLCASLVSLLIKTSVTMDQSPLPHYPEISPYTRLQIQSWWELGFDILAEHELTGHGWM